MAQLFHAIRSRRAPRPLSAKRAYRIAYGLIALAAACLLPGCGDDYGTSDPPLRNDGLWVTDTAFTVDEFPFRTAACDEVFPAGSVNPDSIPADALVHILIRSTACYRLRVRVVNADSDTVRTLDSRFKIFNRTETDKNRAETGYIAWDGKDEKGAALPAGDYLWRMDFDFGLGRIRKFRALFTLP